MIYYILLFYTASIIGTEALLNQSICFYNSSEQLGIHLVYNNNNYDIPPKKGINHLSGVKIPLSFTKNVGAKVRLHSAFLISAYTISDNTIVVIPQSPLEVDLTLECQSVHKDWKSILLQPYVLELHYSLHDDWSIKYTSDQPRRFHFVLNK